MKNKPNVLHIGFGIDFPIFNHRKSNILIHCVMIAKFELLSNSEENLFVIHHCVKFQKNNFCYPESGRNTTLGKTERVHLSGEFVK